MALTATDRLAMEAAEARNAHAEAALILARALDNEEAVAALEQIAAVQDELGYLPHDLGEERYRIMKPLWAAART